MARIKHDDVRSSAARPVVQLAGIVLRGPEDRLHLAFRCVREIDDIAFAVAEHIDDKTLHRHRVVQGIAHVRNVARIVLVADDDGHGITVFRGGRTRRGEHDGHRQGQSHQYEKNRPPWRRCHRSPSASRPLVRQIGENPIAGADHRSILFAVEGAPRGEGHFVIEKGFHLGKRHSAVAVAPAALIGASVQRVQ